jgi:hypothetical protein
LEFGKVMMWWTRFIIWKAEADRSSVTVIGVSFTAAKKPERRVRTSCIIPVFGNGYFRVINDCGLKLANGLQREMRLCHACEAAVPDHHSSTARVGQHIAFPNCPP